MRNKKKSREFGLKAFSAIPKVRNQRTANYIFCVQQWRVLIYSTLKLQITICKIKKTEQENYQRKNIDFGVCKFSQLFSFAVVFLCEWPVADDKRMAGVAF